MSAAKPSAGVSSLAMTGRATRSAAADSRSAIIKAARTCFARFGVDKTTMEDIARAAEVPRSAVYRAFDSRHQIIEGAIRARVAELAEHLQSVLDTTESFEQALLEVSLATVHAGRHDEEFRTLVGTYSGVQLHDVLTSHNAEIHAFIRGFWAPTFARARAAHLLREGVTDDELVEWLSGVWMMIILRTDLTEAEDRRAIQMFLIPSVLPDCQHEPASR